MPQIKIYLDENLSEHVAEGLNDFCIGHFSDVVVYSTKKEFGRGKPDEEIIPAIGKLDGIMISRDLKIQRTRAQSELCMQHKIGVFFLDLPQDESKHWDLVRSLVNKWEDIIKISGRTRKPFSFRIKNGKIIDLK